MVKKSASRVESTATTSSKSNVPGPSAATIVVFPPLSCPPTSPLTLIPLLDPQILLVPQFLSSETCSRYVDYFATLPLVKPGPPGRNEATRTNSRLAVEDAEFAKRLFTQTGLQDLVKGWEVKVGKRSLMVRGPHSKIRIYRYDEGTFFGKHYDESTRDSGTGFVSYWTLLIYLTGSEDGVMGGETVFYLSGERKGQEKEVVVDIERGLALLHRHGGSDCLLHEGRTVTKGVKWVLRSDLVFG